MNVSHLEYYVTAVREGSYSRAARKLFVSTQAVSRAVRELEKEYGTSLMVREGRGIKPTSVGLLFYDQANLILEECGQLRAIAAPNEETENSLRQVPIAICTAECRGDLFPRSIINSIERGNHSVGFKSYFGISAWCLDLLKTGFVEMALVSESAQNNESMTCRYLTATEPRFAVLPDSPLATKGSISATDLNGYRIALPLDVNSLVNLKHWLAAAGSAVHFESVGLSREQNSAFLEDGGVVMVLEDDQSVLPGIEHTILSQDGETRLRLPIYMWSQGGVDQTRFDRIYDIMKTQVYELRR